MLSIIAGPIKKAVTVEIEGGAHVIEVEFTRLRTAEWLMLSGVFEAATSEGSASSRGLSLMRSVIEARERLAPLVEGHIRIASGIDVDGAVPTSAMLFDEPVLAPVLIALLAELAQVSGMSEKARRD